MKLHHSHSRWITVVLVSSAAVLGLPQAWGQSTGAAAVFEGRPAMAGAQGGLGAMAGPPQGGVGLQGSQGTQLNLRRPRNVDTPADMPQGRLESSSPAQARAAVNGPVAAEVALAPQPDRAGLAKDDTSAVHKAKRAGKRTANRARHGVGEIDATAGASTNSAK